MERPLVEMLRIALPSVVTMTSYTVMQFVDALMVSRIHPPDAVYVSAQGNGGIAVFLAIGLVIGLLTVINTFVAQNLGAGAPQRGAAYAWAGIWISVAASILMIPYALALPAIFASLGHSGALLDLEITYAQIMIAGAVFITSARGIHQYFFGMHRAGIVMGSVIIGGVANVGINYLLIFGKLGLPEMGVAGAAVGTVVGGFCEVAIPMALFLGPYYNREYATRRAWRSDPGAVKDVLRLGWPGGAMFANELFCWSYLMANLLPRAGKAAALAEGMSAEAATQAGVIGNTAGWIALRYMHASFMPAVGLSIAVTAMVGRSMGMRRPEQAAARGWLGLRIAMIYMGLWSVVFILFGEPLTRVFAPETMPPEELQRLVEVGAGVMVAAAVFQIFDAIAITMSGALRGAGDTIWPGLATVVLSWAFIVGGGHAAIRLAPGLGAVGPWIGAAGFIISLGVILLWRFMRGGWRRIRLVDGEAEAAGTGTPASPAVAGGVSEVAGSPAPGLDGVESAPSRP